MTYEFNIKEKRMNKVIDNKMINHSKDLHTSHSYIMNKVSLTYNDHKLFGKDT